MAAGTHIPSVEEIQAHLMKRHGVATPANPLDPVTVDMVNVKQSLQAGGRKRTAAELRAAMDLLMEKYDFSPVEELFKMVTAKTDDGTALAAALHRARR